MGYAPPMRPILPLLWLTGLLPFGSGLTAGCDEAPSTPSPPPLTACAGEPTGLRPVALGTRAAWLSVWSAVPGEALLTGTEQGRGVIARLAGGRLAPEAVPDGPTLWWAWGAPNGPAWAVGEAGRILRRDPDGRWTAEPSGLDDKAVLWGIWGASASDLWAVGGSTRRGGPKAVVLRSSGNGQWHRVLDARLPSEDPTDPLAGRNLYKVWGSGPTEVFVVGEAGIALRWDGQAWATLPGADALLFTVHGHPAGARFAVGGLDQGRVFAVNDTRLEEVPLGALNPLNGVAVSPDGVLAVGARGVMLWNDGLAWCRQRPQPDWATATLHGARLAPARWAVGGDLAAQTAGVILTDEPVDEVALP